MTPENTIITQLYWRHLLTPVRCRVGPLTEVPKRKDIILITTALHYSLILLLNTHIVTCCAPNAVKIWPQHLCRSRLVGRYMRDKIISEWKYSGRFRPTCNSRVDSISEHVVERFHLSACKQQVVSRPTAFDGWMRWYQTDTCTACVQTRQTYTCLRRSYPALTLNINHDRLEWFFSGLLPASEVDANAKLCIACGLRCWCESWL